MAIEGPPIYTLRLARVNDAAYDLAKWADFGDARGVEPLDVYRMGPHYCGCPSSRNPCKHQDVKAQLLLETQNVGHPLWCLAFQEGKGVFYLWDMSTFTTQLPTP